MTTLKSVFAFMGISSFVAIIIFTLFLGMVLVDGNSFGSPAVSYEIGRIIISVSSFMFNYLMFELVEKIDELW